jgi:hypothetical protein
VRLLPELGLTAERRSLVPPSDRTRATQAIVSVGENYPIPLAPNDAERLARPGLQHSAPDCCWFRQSCVSSWLLGGHLATLVAPSRIEP